MADVIEVDRATWRALVARLNQLPKTAQREVREAARVIAADESERIARAALSSDAQSAAVGRFVRARSDRFPAIVAGGRSKARVSGGATRSQLFYGAEFGGGARKTTRQFRPHRGRQGYWFWPTLRADQDRMMARWEQALTGIEREWSDGF